MAGILSSLRYLFADFIGEDDCTPPLVPDGLPVGAATVVGDGIFVSMDYQGASYARLYVERVRRFIDRLEVEGPMVCEIARLMAMRVSYEDPIRIVQLTPRTAPGQRTVDVRKFRVDELIGALPALAANPFLLLLGSIGWLHKPVAIPFSTRSRWGIRRLKLKAALRRWRLLSVRYEEERRWVERWLHMISRALVKQPASAAAVVDTATMVRGFGDAYSQGLADWHAIISMALPSPPSTVPCHYRILRARSRKPVQPRCPIQGKGR